MVAGSSSHRPVVSGVRRYWLRTLTALAALGMMVSARPLAAQETEVLRGIISGPDKKPLEGATVTVTGLTSQRQWTTTTNNKGLYTVLVASAEGEYIISVRRIGFGPQTLHALRTGMSPVIITDARLTEIAQVLVDRNVSGDRNVPGLADGRTIGGNDRDLLAGALFSLDPTDLLSLAVNVPGVMAIRNAAGADSGYSVLGMGADDNNMMIDGVQSKGGNLPSMAIGSATMATNTYDIMRGSFSGGQMFITTRPGGDVFQADFNSTMTNDRLTWTDPSVTYQQPSVLRGAMGIGGPIVKGKLNYQFAMDLSDSRTVSYSLLNAPKVQLDQMGYTRDSVAAFRQILGDLAIPTSFAGIPDKRVGTSGSTSLRVDFRPKASRTLVMSLRGNWNTQGGPGYGASSLPSSGSRNKNTYLSGTLNYSDMLFGFLNQLNATYGYSSDRSEPYAMMPSGTVRTTSVFPDGRTGTTYFRFGGSGNHVSGSTGYNFSVTNELSVFTNNSRHRFKIGAGVNGESSDYSIDQIALGNYSYLSMADLAAGKPSGFSRSINTRGQSTKGVTAFVGLQDEWQASGKLQFSLGFRTEFARPGERPQRNPLVDSLFGMRNDVVPSSVGFVPRLGFSWTPTKGRPAAPGAAVNPGSGVSPSSMAAAQERAMMMSMMGPGMGGIPMGAIPGSGARLLTINGGIGLNRSVIQPYSIARLIDATGLPSTSRYMNCVGAATPAPVWSGTGDFTPHACLDGTGPVELTNARPNVLLYDPSYEPNARWSANLGVDGLRWKGWGLTVNSSFNMGVKMASSIDLNLRRDTAFRLASEANRPVFAGMENIVPASGSIAQNAARIHPQFGAVQRQVSDLRNQTMQVQFSVQPPRPLFGKLPLSLNYTWMPYARSELRGLGGGGGGVFYEGGGVYYSGGASSSTDGDPFRKEWAPGAQSTHSINVGTSYRLWWFNVGMRFNITSGIPYTPMVSGDINGDGSSNDRAFIFDPALSSDPEFATQMQSLLAATTPEARACLQKQFGTIAGRNSCKTDWNVRTDLTLNFTPPRSLGFGDRIKFSAAMVNAGAALVRLTGMENSILGKSQVNPYPNATLLYVNGFDPNTGAFKYRVNQLFGLPQGYGSRNSRLQPFQLRLGGEMRIGGPPRAPMATSLGLLPTGKEPPLDIEQLKAKLRGLTSDPVGPILKLRDSLRLTPEQAVQLEGIGSTFFTQADSVFAPLAEFVAGKGKKMTDIELNTKLPKARSDVAALLTKAKAAANEVLTPAQRLLLPVVSGGARPPVTAPPSGAPTVTPPKGGVEVPPPPGGMPPKVGGG